MDNRTIRLSDAIEAVNSLGIMQDNDERQGEMFSIRRIVEALSALPAVEGWLPIEESDGNLCQVTDSGYVVTAFKQDGHWVAGWQNETMAFQFVLSPTHYMPLPAPPIE